MRFAVFGGGAYSYHWRMDNPVVPAVAFLGLAAGFIGHCARQCDHRLHASSAQPVKHAAANTAAGAPFSCVSARSYPVALVNGALTGMKATPVDNITVSSDRPLVGPDCITAKEKGVGFLTLNAGVAARGEGLTSCSGRRQMSARAVDAASYAKCRDADGAVRAAGNFIKW